MRVAGGGEAGLLGVGDPGHRVGIVGRRQGEEHVEVHAEEPVGVGLAEAAGHDRAPVAALRDITVVAELGHQIGDGVGDAVDVEARLGRRPGEAVAGHRGDDDVEGVGRVAAVGGGIGERAEDVEEFDEGAGPAVGQEERGRVGIRRADVEEVEALTGGGGQEVRPGVDAGLAGAPVVAVEPVGDGFLQDGLGDAEAPGGARGIRGPADAIQALAEVGENGVGHVNRETLDRHCGEDLRSAEMAGCHSVGSGGNASRLKCRKSPVRSPSDSRAPRSPFAETASDSESGSDRDAILRADCICTFRPRRRFFLEIDRETRP
jgi:hypothetical protein